MPFQKGLDKVREAADRSNFSGGASSFIGWKAGEVKIIRFLTDGDDIVLTNLHEFVTCADEKKRSFVCRQEVDQQCPLCEDGTKRREIAFGIAVEREASKVDGKTVNITKLQEAEITEDGKTVTKIVPVVGILHQAPKNFWRWFNDVYDKNGTLLDRDFSVTRVGKKLETTYQSYPEDKQELDLSKFDAFKPDLEELLSRQASKEYYDKFLYGIDQDDEAKSSDSELTPEDLETLRKANEEVAAGASSGDWN